MAPSMGSRSFVLSVLGVLVASAPASANTAPQSLPFTQNWSNGGLITANDDWSAVPGVVGYSDDLSGTTTGIDPRTITAAQTTVSVIANISGPLNTSGGVAEFNTDVVALQATGGDDAPNLVLHLNTTGVSSVRLKYTLRDIDTSTDNTVQPFTAQYRIGGTGAFINISGTYNADASTGPSTTTSQAYDVVLPSECGNVSNLQIRFITTNAVNNDEWLGIDDIEVAAITSPTGVGAATPSAVGPGDATHLAATITSGTNPASTGVTVTCDLTSIGGGATQSLFDDGAHGDGGSGDNVFGFDTTVDALTTGGNKTLACTVLDAQSRTGSFDITVAVSECGNNVLEAGEGCDDGNIAGGTCSDSCEIENGNTCNQTAPGDTGDGSCVSGVCDTTGGGDGTCEAVNVCGNGRVDGTDYCDDGGASNGGGCSADCQLELGVNCTSTAQCDTNQCDTLGSGTCELDNACGNGEVDGTDFCDDGGVTDGGGCSADCQLELGVNCTANGQCDTNQCDLLGSGTCEADNTCGNGEVDGTDFCDDGGTANGGGCSADCQLELGVACTSSLQCDTNQCDTMDSGLCEADNVCGNGEVDGTDYCDDGGTAAGGGCSADCQGELGVVCTASSQCDTNQCDTLGSGTCELDNACGNGEVDGTDSCDDGGVTDGGGCSADCQRELGVSCTSNGQCDTNQCDTVGSGACEVDNVCGNGEVDGTDFCDDGGATNGGGCSSDCQLELGVTCTSSAQCDTNQCDLLGSNQCEADNVCGNGQVDGTDFCDDGGVTNGGGCSSDCQLEIGVTCTSNGQCDTNQCDLLGSNQCEADNTCGNGEVDGTDYCDDGGTSNGGGCSSDCQLELGVTCTSNAQCDTNQCDLLGSNECEADNTCGNGQVDGTDFCDDGGTSNGGGCSADCQLELGVACTSNAQCDTSVCDTPGSDTCEAANVCGNGVVDGTDFCDDGGTSNGGGCSSDCQLENGTACTAAGNASCDSGVCDPTSGGLGTCEAANTCGNGLTEGAEACDDGGVTIDDGCSATCTTEGGFTCSGTPSTCDAVCGDGLLVLGEECDDDGTETGDGCSDVCEVEDGWFCGNVPSECLEECGDGLVVGSEECDDANTDDGDGCNAECGEEDGWVCDKEPSVCTPAALCGDGTLDDGEECDDGNDAGDDGCDATCTVETGYSCDGEPSTCSLDADGDAIPDDDDNCPTIPNPSQADDDDDGAGNACDALDNPDEPQGCCSTGDHGQLGGLVLLAFVTLLGVRRRRR